MITPPRTNILAETLIEDFEPSNTPVSAPTYCSNTIGEIYKPPTWGSARPDPSREIQSHGLSC